VALFAVHSAERQMLASPGTRLSSQTREPARWQGLIHLQEPRTFLKLKPGLGALREHRPKSLIHSKQAYLCTGDVTGSLHSSNLLHQLFRFLRLRHVMDLDFCNIPFASAVRAPTGLQQQPQILRGHQRRVTTARRRRALMG
jgi:hypothetical protein